MTRWVTRAPLFFLVCGDLVVSSLLSLLAGFFIALGSGLAGAGVEIAVVGLGGLGRAAIMLLLLLATLLS